MRRNQYIVCTMPKRSALRWIFFPALVSFLAFAQTPELASKFRLAQSYEQAGRLDQAAVLYKDLLLQDHSNPLYAESLTRVYTLQKNYDSAASVLQQQLALRPNDLQLRATLGSVYYKAGKDQTALAEWEKALATDPANPNVYRHVANVLLENRLLDKAAETYRRGRVACNDPRLFTLDLAQLLAMSMDYAGSTREFVDWLRQNPAQAGFVQNRMATFTAKEDARNTAIETIQSEIRKGDDPRLHEVLAWLYMEGKRYADAFEVYKRLDGLTNARGAVVYGFAERAFKERAFDVAARAYQEAIRIPVAAARLPYAKFGYASTLKELGAIADTLDRGPGNGASPATEAHLRYAGAIAYFQEIIKEYPRSELSARSYYQVGLIQFEKFFDLDGALGSLQHVEDEQAHLRVLRHDAGLRIAEVLTCKGDTAHAAVRLRAVAGVPTALPNQQDEANFRLAELEYFGGQFAAARKRLEGISSNLQADFTNDALLLQAFLSENMGGVEPALQLFARADFLARRRQLAEALLLYRQVVSLYPQALLVDDALMKVASIQSTLRMYEDAIGTYERLLTDFSQTSIALDKAQFNIGDVCQHGLRDMARATSAYEKLLAQWPRSPLADEARQRIRTLRGDSL